MEPSCSVVWPSYGTKHVMPAHVLLVRYRLSMLWCADVVYSCRQGIEGRQVWATRTRLLWSGRQHNSRNQERSTHSHSRHQSAQTSSNKAALACINSLQQSKNTCAVLRPGPCQKQQAVLVFGIPADMAEMDLKRGLRGLVAVAWSALS